MSHIKTLIYPTGNADGWYLYDADNEYLAAIPFTNEHAEQVAREIVRAVNALGALVEMCTALYEVLNRDGKSLEDSFEARYQAALVLARGDQ